MTTNFLTVREKKARSLALSTCLSEAVVRGLKRGEIMRIAKEFGVTRQYVSYLKSRFDESGDKHLGEYGRRNERPFTERERHELLAVLRGKPPSLAAPVRRADVLARLEELEKNPCPVAPEGTSVLWTLLQARNWFGRTYAHTVKVHYWRAFAKESGIIFAEEGGPSKTSKAANWTKAFLTDEFRRWQATPQAEELRRRETALKLMLEERRKNTPSNRKRGRPPKITPAHSLDVSLSACSPNPIAPAAERKRSPGRKDEPEAGPRLYSHDPCPLDNSREFGHCCGLSAKRYCLKQAAAAAADKQIKRSAR